MSHQDILEVQKFPDADHQRLSNFSLADQDRLEQQLGEIDLLDLKIVWILNLFLVQKIIISKWTLAKIIEILG